MQDIRLKFGTVAVAAASAMLLHTAVAQAQSDRSVTVVLSDEPVSLEPCVMDVSVNGRVVKQNIVETLTEIDPDNGNLKPRLATSWEKIDDKTWRFMLRDGVTFSDGAPFNADTAAKAIDRTMNTSLDCSIRTRFFNEITFTTTAVDRLTLDVMADQPVPILPTQMGVIGISSPNLTQDKLTNEPVGSGPYVLDNWDGGQEVVLTRNDNYWGDRPEATDATFVWRTESSVRASMVKIGEADFAPNIAAQDANEPSMDVSYLNSETTWLKIDVTREPLNDVRIRRALNLAVDRVGLRGTIFPKDAIPATQVVIPAVAGHNSDLDDAVWPYDPDKARQLIAEAKADGVPVDKEIKLIGRINLYPNVREASEALTGMFTAVGLNVKMEMLDRALWLDINRKPFAEDRDPVLLMSQHDNDKGDAVFSVHARYACDGLTANICDPKVDELIQRASVLSNEERAETWQEVFRIVYEDIVSDVNLFHMVGFSRVGPRINYTPTVATNSEVQIGEMTFR